MTERAVGTGLLRQPAFLRLCLASACSETAEWMLQIALPLLVFRLTGSASLTATGVMLGLLPVIVLSPVAGVLADRWDRRRVLCAVGAGQLVACLPLVAVSGLPVLYAVMAAQAGLASLFEPARNALAAELAGTARVTEANGLLSTVASVARLAGAWAGGLLLSLGGATTVIIGYGALLIAGIGLLLRPFPANAAPGRIRPSGPVLRSWLDGLGEFRRSRTLRVTGAVMALVAIGQGMFLVLFVLFVVRTLSGSDADVGLLRGVQAVGGIIAGLVLATVARRAGPTVTLGLGCLGIGLLGLVTWRLADISTAMPLYVVMFVLIGMPAVLAGSGLIAVLQQVAGPAKAGRVLSTVLATEAAFVVLGTQLAGLLVDTVGLPVLLTAHSSLYLVAGVVAVLLLVVRVRVERRPAERQVLDPVC